MDRMKETVIDYGKMNEEFIGRNEGSKKGINTLKKREKERKERKRM